MSDILTPEEILEKAPGIKELTEWERNQRIVLCLAMAQAQCDKLHREGYRKVPPMDDILEHLQVEVEGDFKRREAAEGLYQWLLNQ